VTRRVIASAKHRELPVGEKAVSGLTVKMISEWIRQSESNTGASVTGLRCDYAFKGLRMETNLGGTPALLSALLNFSEGLFLLVEYKEEVT